MDKRTLNSLECLMLVGIVTLLFLLAEPAFAAEGEQIFTDAGKAIVCDVLPGKFGAMLSGFAGIFAIVAAVTGNFRGAWALLFVSVGCYIAGDMVKQLFSVISC